MLKNNLTSESSFKSLTWALWEGDGVKNLKRPVHVINERSLKSILFSENLGSKKKNSSTAVHKCITGLHEKEALVSCNYYGALVKLLNKASWDFMAWQIEPSSFSLCYLVKLVIKTVLLRSRTLGQSITRFRGLTSRIEPVKFLSHREVSD